MYEKVQPEMFLGQYRHRKSQALSLNIYNKKDVIEKRM